MAGTLDVRGARCLAGGPLHLADVTAEQSCCQRQRLGPRDPVDLPEELSHLWFVVSLEKHDGCRAGLRARQRV